MSTPTPSSVPLHPLPRKHWPRRLSLVGSTSQVGNFLT
jgi:hypothetical protein